MWSRVVRLIETHPDVKQVRLNVNEHSVSVGFYETPLEETLDQIKNDVRAALSGQWDVSITPDDKSPTIHLHKIDDYTTEFHRAHPSDEPSVIWKRIPLPTWRNRPFPRPVPRDYRVMLLLAAIVRIEHAYWFSPRSRRNSRQNWSRLSLLSPMSAADGSPLRMCGTRSSAARSTFSS